jgi:hypothetical protein
MKSSWFIFFLLIAHYSIAQQNFSALQEKEKMLKSLAYRIVNDTTEKGRVDAVVRFIPALVEALKIPESFVFPFDSLIQFISIQQSPDKSFRIFSWQLNRDNGAYRYYGAIQKNNPAQLELFPLFDYSDSLLANESVDLKNAVLDNKHWKGAVYYNIIERKVKNQTYYFLFGWDGNDLWSNRKIIEALYFKNGNPVFGAPLFVMQDESLQHRFLLEYRDEATVSMNYVDEEKIIVFDHLVAPEQRMADLKFTFMPDGSYSGFKWKKGKWNYVDKLKVKTIGEFDKPPVPKPVNFEKEKKQIQRK